MDVDAATEKGIPVVICPAANTNAVAEHTVALMFAIAKNIVESDVETRKGNFSIRNKYSAVELHGRTVGIIGFGNIGRAVARICSCLGMNICAYDPFISRENVESLGYTYTEDPVVAFRAGDFITLHIAVTACDQEYG